MPRGRWRGREEIKLRRPSVRRGGKEDGPCGSRPDAAGSVEEHMPMILFCTPVMIASSMHHKGTGPFADRNSVTTQTTFSDTINVHSMGFS